MVLPAGISPATWRFEAARSNSLSYGSIAESEWWNDGLMIDAPRSSVRWLSQSNTPMLHLSIPRYGADGETRTPVGRTARQFTKLLLSLLSHAGVPSAECRLATLPPLPYSALFILNSSFERWWVATVLPRALRFKKPLHRCNACNPSATRRRS